MSFLPPLFITTQKIYSFLNSMISANHDKVEGYSVYANGKILKKVFDTLFNNLFCIQIIEYDLCLTDPT